MHVSYSLKLYLFLGSSGGSFVNSIHSPLLNGSDIIFVNYAPLYSMLFEVLLIYKIVVHRCVPKQIARRERNLMAN